jgi:hypothetical protein
LYALYSKPYEGEVALKNIQKKKQLRLFDEFGVPHIYAANSDAMDCIRVCPCRIDYGNGTNAPHSSGKVVRNLRISSVKK